jgi:hypothetical protein
MASQIDQKTETVSPSHWQKQLIQKLTEKVPKAFCRFCSEIGTLRVAADIVTPMTWIGGSMVVGTAYPQAMLICTNCGYTHYLNLLALGVTLEGKAGGGTT